MTQQPTQERRHVVRFAGDSGDGIQLQGQQFTTAAALSGHDLATLPDFPAEIRAPVGTRFGVSAFQIQFGGERITTPGDTADVLIAFGPAALVVNLRQLHPGATIIVDSNAFTPQKLKRADLDSNPLEDGTLSNFKVLEIEISRMTAEATKPHGLGTKDSGRCKNFWALGLALWMFEQSQTAARNWINQKFGKQEATRDANIAALAAGYAYGETMEVDLALQQKSIPIALLPAAEYRTITGAETIALGLVAAAEQADVELLFCSYPITPASSVLHHLAGLEEIGVATFQAEDEIAAICTAIGASYAGKLGITSSSGPGIALKTEAIGLAVAAELPLIIINSQRSGPSTGMPTKTEQSDLYQAIYGRNGDTPIPVIAARSPGDCFDATIEAVTVALRHMTPVMLLTDSYIANASELWPVPDLTAYPKIKPNRPSTNGKTSIFARDESTHARLWAIPGDENHIHRIGGLERDIDTGHISYEPENHQAMTDMRAAKVASVANFMPPQEVEIGTAGVNSILVIAWGSTYGIIHQAVKELLSEGHEVAHVHLRRLYPLPHNLRELLLTFGTILAVEMNKGQLATVLRDQLLLEISQLNQVTGQPFTVAAIKEHINNLRGVAVDNATNQSIEI